MLITLLFYFRIIKTCPNTCVWSLDNHGLTGEAAGTMQHPWGWWFLNQQKSQTTGSSEQVSLETECRRSLTAFQVSTHKYRKKTCKKGKQREYRPREGPGTARTQRSVLVVYINSRKRDPTYTPHEKTALYLWFYFDFTPSLPSPLYLFF